MGRLYVHFALFLQATLIVSGLFLFITLHPKTTDYIAKKVLTSNGIGYRRIEGSLFNGFDLYDLSYKKAFSARQLGIHYTLFSLFSPRPAIESVTLADVKIHPLRFPEKTSKSGVNDSGIVLPPILFEQVDIEHCITFLPEDEAIEFDLKIKNLLLDKEAAEIERFNTKIESSYAFGEVSGSIHNGTVKAEGSVSPGKRYEELAETYLENFPKSFPVKLNATMQRLEAATRIDEKIALKDTNLSIQNFTLRFNYLFKGNYFTAKSNYRLEHSFVTADIDQSLLFTPSLAYAARMEGRISSSRYPLPADRFEADAAGDTDTLTSDFYIGPFSLNAYSTDYKKYALHLVAKPHSPSYIQHLPQILLRQSIGMEANATAVLEPEPTVEGVVALDGNYSTTKSFIEMKPDMMLVHSSVTPKKSGGGIWEELPPPLIGEIESFLFLSKEKKMFNISTTKSYLTLFEKRGKIEGWANIGSLTLDAKGEVEPDGTTNLDFITHIESLHELMEEFDLKSDVMIDAELTSHFSVSLAERLQLTYKTEIPWYLVEPDSQTLYYGLDSLLEGGIDGEEVRIDRYSVAIMDHRLEQNRSSYFHFDENLTLFIDKLAFLDKGMAKGYFDLRKGEGSIALEGRGVHYNGPEGNVTADLQITASLSPASLSAEGEIGILDALIVYKPPKEYTVNDEDIVIIQDIKEPSHTKKSLNIHIFSKKALHYRIPMVDVYFIPDVTIWKEAEKPAVLLGMVKVVEGSLNVAEKYFDIEPSEIYFSGAHPINPWLDLHILYEVDFNKFHIYVSHSLSNPVFLFSSEPPMSQNDIMSYILFGEPADESFKQNGSSESTIGTMLLGAGLKTAIGSATGIRFDTLNILNTPEGGFGIEVGKRLSRRIRIIYRNDSVSSFIIQYKASRSVRIDVDVKDTGQGINVLYVKDIRGFP
ncbi:translocation/assembly module TamB domain-containing protein [Hydrogenimonas cancrithermarum]|uniref:Translocation and assembly module TamB C-terminal domain-containing protein n=1 Tax=Hydrogenimonas cancrithermarum TaxID=2993563 RepID=A0ABM8FHL5_9BACT|nr:translocation/assembly module TamB domain-containing protein [Hydrogenimonas cancrithermarum]BDY11785.1 hypothetical protein HCR_00970 [Hydrogenimonas cancrithermarum]